MQDTNQLLGSLGLLFVFCSLWVSFCSMALVVGDSLLCELLHLNKHRSNQLSSLWQKKSHYSQASKFQDIQPLCLWPSWPTFRNNPKAPKLNIGSTTKPPAQKRNQLQRNCGPWPANRPHQTWGVVWSGHGSWDVSWSFDTKMWEEET